MDLVDSAVRTLDHDEFWSGATAGIVVAVVLGLVAAGRRLLGRPSPAGWGGVAFLVAATAGIDGSIEQPLGGIPAGALLLLLAAGGLMVASRWTVPIGLVAGVVGAWMIAARSGFAAPWWARALCLAVIVAGGWAIVDHERRAPSRSLGLAFLGVTVVGVYVTVPETERALALVGAVAPLAPFALPWGRPLVSVGAASGFAVAGLVAWVVLLDGRARPAAVVGGLGCLGLLVLEPVVRRFRAATADRDRRWLSWPLLPTVLVVHVGLVLAASRWAGLRQEAVPAAVLVALSAAVAAGVLVAVGYPFRPAPADPTRVPVR